MDASTISIVISSVLLITFIVGHIRNTIALRQIHDLVNSKMTKTLNKVEALEAKVESLGGPKAPPKRDQDAD